MKKIDDICEIVLTHFQFEVFIAVNSNMMAQLDFTKLNVRVIITHENN